MSLARATEKHSEEVAAKKKERRVKKRMTKVNPDPSIHGEDVTKEQQDSSSSESSDIDRTPLGLMLADPRPPKQDPGKAKRKELESLPVLQLFNHHLKDFEGGSRKHEVAKDHTRRVCRLLHELEENASFVNPLWDSGNLNKLKNNFFKGNDLLGEEETADDIESIHHLTAALLQVCHCPASREPDITTIRRFRSAFSSFCCGQVGDLAKGVDGCHEQTQGRHPSTGRRGEAKSSGLQGII